MKRKILTVVAMVCVIMMLAGCTEADKVNANISKQADYFECERWWSRCRKYLRRLLRNWKKKK